MSEISKLTFESNFNGVLVKQIDLSLGLVVGNKLSISFHYLWLKNNVSKKMFTCVKKSSTC